MSLISTISGSVRSKLQLRQALGYKNRKTSLAIDWKPEFVPTARKIQAS
jgi:hypothetical protein